MPPKPLSRLRQLFKRDASMRPKAPSSAMTATGVRERSTATKVGYLSEIDIFQDLTEQEIDALGQVTTMITCEAGRVFYVPGQTGEALFLLKKGRVQLYRLSLEGRKLIITILGPGTFFGEMALLGQGMHDALAEAVEDSTICVMSHHDVEQLLLQKPLVALRLLNALGNRLTEAETRLEEMAFQGCTARVASLLLRLAREGVVEGLTHQDLADILGIYRETATHTLDGLKAAGLIEIGRRNISVLDPDGLRQIAQETPSASA